MNTNASDANPLCELVGSELSAVVFVRDYVQLQFDGPLLTAINLPLVEVRGEVVADSQPGYRDSLCARIGIAVIDTSIEVGHRLTLRFEDESTIHVSLREADYRGPEAVQFRGQSGQMWVW